MSWLTPEETIFRESLFDKSDEELIALARGLEFEGNESCEGIPADRASRLLRPFLAYVPMSTRMMPPMRWLCVPFEDMFHPTGVREFKVAGIVARSSIEPFWEFVTRCVPEAEFQRCHDDLMEAAASGDSARVIPSVHTFWATVGERAMLALHGIERDPTELRALRKEAGNSMAVADIGEMARYVAVAPHIMKMRDLFPSKPVIKISRQQAKDVHEVFRDLNREDEGKSTYFFYAALGRLFTPEAVATMIKECVPKRENDAQKSRPFAGGIEIFLYRLDQILERLLALDPKNASHISQYINLCERFALGTRLFLDHMQLSSVGEWKHRLTELNKEIYELLHRVTIEESGTIMTLPLSIEFGGRVLSMDVPPYIEDFRAAEAQAHALVRFGEVSQQLGNRTEASLAARDVREQMKLIRDKMMKLDPNTRPKAFLAHFAVIARLTEILEDSAMAQSAWELANRGAEGLRDSVVHSGGHKKAS